VEHLNTGERPMSGDAGVGSRRHPRAW